MLPPRIVVARKPDGAAPLTHSFLRVDGVGGAAVVSAIKKAEQRDSVIVRLFNPDEVAAEARIATDVAVRQAFAVNLLEERQQELMVERDGIHVRLKPHQIQTIELVT